MSDYQGRRTGEEPLDEPTAYRGRRSDNAEPPMSSDNNEQRIEDLPEHLQEEFRPEQRFDYDPFAAYAEADFDQSAHANAGTPFDIKKGRHEALVESAYSTEIDGGEMLTLAKRRGFHLAPRTVFGLIVAAVLIFGSFVFLHSNFSSPAPNETVLSNVLPQRFPQVHPSSNYTTVTFKNGAFAASSGSTLAIPAHDVKPAAEKCVIVSSADFCLAGTGVFAGTLHRVFYTNDIVQSPTFATMDSFKEISGNKQQLIGDTVVNFGGQPTRFLIFVDGVQGDGWFVEIPVEGLKNSAPQVLNDTVYVP